MPDVSPNFLSACGSGVGARVVHEAENEKASDSGTVERNSMAAFEDDSAGDPMNADAGEAQNSAQDAACVAKIRAETGLKVVATADKKPCFAIFQIVRSSFTVCAVLFIRD